jgi:hypothetical protein
LRTLTISDQTGGERPAPGITLPAVPDRLTAQELIRLRIREEVARHNASRVERLGGILQLNPDEVARNRARPSTGTALDWEEHAAAACRSFERNRYYLFVGGRQVTGLDQEIDLTGDPEVLFLKLLPLVGG